MPIPSPNKGESKKDFIQRCMSDNVMNEEFKDNKQRIAVCYQKWEDKKKQASIVLKSSDDELIFG